MSSSTNLTDALLDALRESESLIVVCSRRSASSKWVNAEIEKFIELGRGDRIFALIVDETDGPVFPTALLSHGNEPLAADVHRDGKRNAFLKTVAGLLSLRFDELRQRHEQKRQRRMLTITFASLVGLVITSALAIFALLAREEAEQARIEANNSKKSAQQVTNFLVGILEKANPTNRNPDDISIREVLDNGYAMAGDSLQENPQVRAAVLRAISGAYNTLGFFSRNVEIREDILEALRQSESATDKEIGRAMMNHAGALSLMVTAKTDMQAEIRYDQAVAFLGALPEVDFYLLGTAHIGLGNLYLFWETPRIEEAVTAYGRAIAFFERMPEPDVVKLSWAHQNMGLAHMDRDDLENARRSFSLAEDFASEHGQDLILLSTIKTNLGELLMLSGEPDKAEKKIAKARDLFIELLGESHPRVVGATRYLATAEQQQGDFDRAERLYGEALRLAELVDGGSRGALIAKITAYLGDLASARNQPEEAEALYRRALFDMELNADAPDLRSELAAHGVKRYPTLN